MFEVIEERVTRDRLKKEVRGVVVCVSFLRLLVVEREKNFEFLILGKHMCVEN